METASRAEDGYAYCQVRFLDTGDPTWVWLPMKNIAVRAMDAVTEFLARKRGRTTVRSMSFPADQAAWTTWSVDPRVVAVSQLSSTS